MNMPTQQYVYTLAEHKRVQFLRDQKSRLDQYAQLKKIAYLVCIVCNDRFSAHVANIEENGTTLFCKACGSHCDKNYTSDYPLEL